jgi:hypothetical protein
MNLIKLNRPFPNARTPEPERAKGIHVTDILHAVEMQLYPNKWQPEPPDTTQLRFAAGFTWEELLTMAFGKRLAPRLPEQRCEGILLNPDGVWLTSGGNGLIAEYKLTWRSSRHIITDNWYWMAQAKSYCYCWGLNRVVFYVFYVNGDYKSRQPEWNGGELIEFTDEEIMLNWNMILNNKHLVEG